MKSLVSALLLTGISSFLLSAAWGQQPGASGQYYDYIYKVNVGDDGYLYINVSLNGGQNLATNCSNNAFAVSKYTLSDDRTRAWMQMSLAAFLARKKVWIETAGCNQGGTSGYPIMTKLQLEENYTVAPSQ